MALDIENLLQYYNIEYVQSGHKHARHGWVQIKCPFCFGTDGWHLGYSQQHDWWNCWRCGFHKSFDVLESLTGSRREAKEALRNYNTYATDSEHKTNNASKLVIPSLLDGLTNKATEYLQKRKFEANRIATEWNITSVDPKDKTYKHRIYIPIDSMGRTISFQCRDITGKSSYRYLGPSEADSLMNYKSVLYGLDYTKGDACVVVEGVTDVWRFGYGSVATFGIKFTNLQVLELSRRFKQVHILYDNEDVAKIQASKLVAALKLLNVDAVLWDIDSGDPGELDQKEADTFMDSVLGLRRFKLL